MESVFSIEDSLRFGWKKTKENSLVLFQVVLTLFAVEVVQSIVKKVLEGTLLGSAAMLALITLGVILGTGFIHITLKVARSEAIAYKDIIPPMRMAWHMFLTSLITGILIGVGIILLIIPGIYLMLRFSMVRFAVVDGEDVLDSLTASSDLTRGVKWELLGFLVVIIIINILGALLFMVGLILTVPVTMIAFAHVYQKLLERNHAMLAHEGHDHTHAEGHEHHQHPHEHGSHDHTGHEHHEHPHEDKTA